MFVVASLILVAGIVAIANLNTVQAAPHKHSTEYCSDKNDPRTCYPTKDECEAAIVLGGKGKCFRTNV